VFKVNQSGCLPRRSLHRCYCRLNAENNRAIRGWHVNPASVSTASSRRVTRTRMTRYSPGELLFTYPERAIRDSRPRLSLDFLIMEGEDIETSVRDLRQSDNYIHRQKIDDGLGVESNSQWLARSPGGRYS